MLRARAVTALCAAGLVAVLLSGCGYAELRQVGAKGVDTVNRTIDRTNVAVDQAEALTKANIDEALVAVRAIDQAPDDKAIAAATRKFEAKAAVIKMARSDRNENGPPLVLEKLLEALERIVERLKDD